MSRMRSSRRERFFSTLILLFSICAVILAAAIVVDAKLNRAADAPALNTADFVDAGTPAPLTLKTADTPAPTEVPADATEAPAATPVPSETYDFLPVYTGADTEEKVVAVVLEDCSNAANLRTAASACAQMGAKLTLFPLGRVVMQQGMDDILRTCISDLGFEVENRTWSDSLIYRLSDSDMASEIWSPGIAVDYILDADYGMHLFHMRGGSGARDARTHSYLKQLGYNYDRGGNILSKVRYAYTTGALGTALETIPYAYGDANWKDKLTAYNGKAITYDAIGNPLTDGTWTYQWQASRQLKQMTKSGTTIQFKYDHNGLRVGKVVIGAETKYMLHGKLVTHLTVGSDNLHFLYDA